MNLENKPKLTDQEIEREVSQCVFLAGRSFGGSYKHVLRAENYAKQHSQYETKYQKEMELLKSIYKVSSFAESLN